MKVVARPSAMRTAEVVTEYTDVQLVGTTYPSAYMLTGGVLVQPILETTQSTGVSTTDVAEMDVSPPPVRDVHTEPVFFFLYNTDNYFHFLYDAVPTLHAYLQMTPRPTLLITSKPLYPFVVQTLRLLGISEEQCVRARSDVRYSRVLVSSSPTHEGCSNEPPMPLVWDVYARLREAAGPPSIPLPTKIYVSRRTWVHGDLSNIGTNYTTRRRLECEDALVTALTQRGYTEVFCESMTMSEKIQMFAGATHVVGAIGGGLCNLVFAQPHCRVVCLASPEFERINRRFLYTMDHTQLTMFRSTWSTSMLYRRAKVGADIGEVVAEDGDMITLALGNGVTWSADAPGVCRTVPRSDALFLDEGLNSPWNFDVTECMEFIQ